MRPTTRPSGSSSRASIVIPAWAEESRSISIQAEAASVIARSAPRRKPNSAAIIQSGRAVPGGVTFWRTVLTRPSRLVVVPSTSAAPAAGNTMSTAADDELSTVSRAITVRAPFRPREASSRSGKSASGSAPSSTRVSIRPSAAAARMPAVSRPVSAGTVPQASPNQSRPSSSVTRPGRNPGTRPISMAPCTLARRRPDKNFTLGKAATREAAAATVASADSANEPRPSSTVRCSFARAARTPERSPSPAMIRSTSSLTAPGVERSEWVAISVSEVTRGESSTTVARLRVTASRMRRKSTASSSLGSDPITRRVPPAAQASSMVALGSPAISEAGRPSPNWASTLSVPMTPLASLAQA